MLYLVATPIGNLGDFTPRAVQTLQGCDYILCEDTRHSLPLLTHFGVQKPLHSFHKFNEAKKEHSILQDLAAGKNIALISDAGTPGISDPGARLVQQCVQANIPVISIPGACAAIVALSCSGLDTERFQFFGFLPKKSGELRRALQEIAPYTGTTICYESPHRLLELLSALHNILPNRNLVVARELTKKFEEIQRGTAEQLLTHYQKEGVRGEIILLISGSTESIQDWTELSPSEHVAFLQHTYQLSTHDAIKMAAEMRGVPKRDVYNIVQNPKAAPEAGGLGK